MAEIPLPTPPLADDAVALRPWRETDIPAQLEAFGDAWFQRFSDWAPHTEDGARRYLAAHERARDLRSHVAFQGGRRDTVVFSLLPGELR